MRNIFTVEAKQIIRPIISEIIGEILSSVSVQSGDAIGAAYDITY